MEAAVVGPGNRTDFVTMYVFRARGFKTDQEARDHVAEVRRDIRNIDARLIEGPLVFRGKDDFTAFYAAYRGDDQVMHQVQLMYLRGRLYRFTCDFLWEHGPDMDQGCKHALDSLEIEGLGDVPQ